MDKGEKPPGATGTGGGKADDPRRPASRLILGALVGAALLLPVGVALASPHLAGAPSALLVATATGTLALGLLVFQVVLPGRPRVLVRALGAGLMRLHRLVALLVVGLVLLHVAALFVYSPDDALYSFTPAAPTHSRLGVAALVCLALTVALGRRWRGAGRPEWRVLHVALAAAVLGAAFAHGVTIQGALDGLAGTLLLYAGMAIAGAAVLYAGLWRPLGSRRQEQPRKKQSGDPAP